MVNESWKLRDSDQKNNGVGLVLQFSGVCLIDRRWPLHQESVSQHFL